MNQRLLRLLPARLHDLLVELDGHRHITRSINSAKARGDQDALAVFHTGTLAAALTRKGMFRRGDEVLAYAQLVLAKDGTMHRYNALFTSDTNKGDLMAYPRFTLEPRWIDVDVTGWELTGETEAGDHVAECHELFHADDDNADIEAAMGWAEDIIGTRQDWLHVRERGFDRWEAGTRS
ncbi:hypothetical protein ACFYNM_39315 [Streptomyces spororaveus]|uniref:hypothetical protein n=1 Tax=Streptomyces spororaveus TaxID=284039 RepID=UPI0036B610D5